MTAAAILCVIDIELTACRCFTKHIPEDTIVFKLSEMAEAHDRKKLNSDELMILSLVNGARTVRNIMDESGFDEFVSQKILYSFIAAGIIEK